MPIFSSLAGLEVAEKFVVVVGWGVYKSKVGLDIKRAQKRKIDKIRENSESLKGDANYEHTRPPPPTSPQYSLQ